MFSNLFSKYCFQIFCLAAQVWKLKHRMARGGLKVLRLTSGSGNPTVQRLQKLKMIDINLSRNMRRKVFSSGRSSWRSQAKVEVFICYRFFELWHNLLLPTHWLSSLLKFQAIMVLSNLSFRCLKSKCLVGWIWLDISDQIDVVDNFTPTNEDNLTRCCGLTLSVWSWKLCLTLYWRQRPVCVKKTIGQGGNLLMSRKEKFRKSWKAIVHRCFPNSPSQESKATSMTKNGSKWWKDWGEGGCQPGRLGNPFGGAGRSSWILLSRFPPTFSDWTLFKFLNLRVVSHFWRCTLTGPDPALRWQPSLPRWRWAKGKAIS